ALHAELLACYHAMALDSYRIDHEDIAKRDLRNLCLSYLAFSPQSSELVRQQYHAATNMTDSLAALSSSVAASLPSRDELLDHFEKRWHSEALVLDKWFSLNAAILPVASAIPRIQTLMEHPSFSLNNPNRVYSLIGSFASGNPAAFHSLDGTGYAFLGDVLLKLDDINPQTTSRLVDPLLRWKRYGPQRGQLMLAQLKRLSIKVNLSSDLSEKLHKAIQLDN
ncbi:MAG: aminopeptidase N C-terminal domain-containing protein, partial [archaeon]|nr:aminopeptidase N C-terminal domain-containing protein [archaeon]